MPSGEFEVEFLDPPDPQKKRKSMWDERLPPLIDNPNKWTKVWEGRVSTAYSIAGQLRTIAPNKFGGEWVFTARTLDAKTRKGAVFGKYLPELSDLEREILEEG